MSSISQHYFKGIIEHLAELGFSEEVVKQHLAQPIAFSHDDTHRFNSELYYQLLDIAADLTNDELYGATLGERIALSDYGVLGYLVASCSNLSSAIEVLLDYDALVADIGKAELVLGEHSACIRWYPENAASMQSILRNTVAWISSVRHLLGEQYTPLALDFTFTLSPQSSALLQQRLGCNVNHGQPYNAIHFSNALLTLPFRGHNALVFDALQQASNKALTQLNATLSTSQRVAQVLKSKEHLINCQQQDVASELAMSTRQMQRKLQNENTRFTELLESERKRRVMQLLGKQSMLAIAQQLGFSEQASFNHAFKRWFGYSPRHYLMKQK